MPHNESDCVNSARRVESDVIMSKTVAVRTFLQKLRTAWTTERPTRQAAALAYYGVFSLAPMLYIILTVAGMFLNQVALGNELFNRLSDILGQETASFIRQMVVGASQRSTGDNALSTLISLGALLYAATGLFAQLKYSLNSIWHVSPQTQGGVKGFITTRLLAFGSVLGTGLVIILAILGSVMASFVITLLGFDSRLFTGNAVTFLALSAICFVLLYRVLPDRKIAWGDVWIGGLVAALLFTIGRWGLGIYLSHSNISTAFAAAGALAVVLIAINYSAQIFLFGALIGRVYATTYGSHAGSVDPDPPA